MGVGKANYLRRRIELLERELIETELKEQRFEEFKKLPNGTVLTWNQKFDHNGLTYTFCAIKAAGYWYTSGIFQRVKMPLDQLIDKHLQYAVDDEILKAKKWTEV